MPVPVKLRNKARQLAPGSIIELYVLDTSELISKLTGLPGAPYPFHNYNDNGADTLHFQAIPYLAYPIQASGFEISSQGKFARPTITFGNIGWLGSALLREFDELIGARITRTVTLYEFLDDQPGADPLQAMPPDIYEVDSKTDESNTSVTLQLAHQIDVEMVKLPRRSLMANSCTWRYRSGDGCDYTGPAVTNEFDVDFGATTMIALPWNSTTAYAVNDDVSITLNGVTSRYVCLIANTGKYPRFNPTFWSGDVCIKTLSACRKRFGQNGVLPTSVFPAMLRAPISN